MSEVDCQLLCGVVERSKGGDRKGSWYGPVQKSQWDPCDSGQVSRENPAGIGKCVALAGLHGWW